MTSLDDLVTVEDLSTKPHEPESIIDSRTKHLRNKQIREFKIKWMDMTLEDSTWEREDTLKLNFPNFLLQECNTLKWGRMLQP